MKPTKKVIDVAVEVIKNDPYLKEKGVDFWVSSVADTLMKVRNAMMKGRYYTGVESVSASGMSRVIKIGWIENNDMNRAPDYVYKLAGCDKNNRIGGCGMDMLFAAQYNLFQALCDQKRTPYQSHMKNYRLL